MDGAAMHSIFWRDESGRNAAAGEAGLSNQEARKKQTADYFVILSGVEGSRELTT